ncbi:PRD domain-containing protein [Paenibacillus sp. GCM10027626]|uniref:PRD domain-containing protein n=1 Tax=Paenibacillus sp. GCM10027626 TaxID=3273411 RepID=UPI003631A2C1
MNGLLQIERIVGNNVILTLDPHTSREYVLFGKGIGFSSRGEKWIDVKNPCIEKRYRLDEQEPMQQYHSLVEDINPGIIQLSEQIIERIKERIGTPVNPKVYFALPNHIHFAIYRLRNGMDINNPFLFETRMSFPREYEIAAEAAAMISEQTGVPIPEDEIGFLALHVYSCTEPVSVVQLVKLTRLINTIVERVEQLYGRTIARNSSNHARFIAHLRGMLERLLHGKTVTNPLVKEIREQHPQEFAVATEITEFIEQELKIKVSIDEIGYMSMHLHRLFQ